MAPHHYRARASPLRSRIRACLLLCQCGAGVALAGTWSAWGSGASGQVNEFAVDAASGRVFVGGLFTTIGGVSASRVAMWDGAAFRAMGSGVGGSVEALAVAGNNVFVGGSFTTAGGQTANYIAVWNGAAWSPLGSGTNAQVLAITTSGTDMWVGGRFTTAGGQAANYIAKWDGTAWSALGSGTNNAVNAIAVAGTDVIVGGAFTTAGGGSAKNIAIWTGTGWTAMGSGFGAAVNDIVVMGNDIVLGGVFSWAGSPPLGDAAKWDGIAWASLGSTTSNITSTTALAVVAGTRLYAARRWNAVVGATTGVSVWDGTSWEHIIPPGTSGVLNDLFVVNGVMYVGGSFSAIAGVAASNLATWSPADPSPTPTSTPSATVTMPTTASATSTPTESPSSTATRSATLTATCSPTVSVQPSTSRSESASITASATASASESGSPSPTMTESHSFSATATEAATATASSAESATATATETPSTSAESSSTSTASLSSEATSTTSVTTSSQTSPTPSGDASVRVSLQVSKSVTPSSAIAMSPTTFDASPVAASASASESSSSSPSETANPTAAPNSESGTASATPGSGPSGSSLTPAATSTPNGAPPAAQVVPDASVSTGSSTVSVVTARPQVLQMHLSRFSHRMVQLQVRLNFWIHMGVSAPSNTSGDGASLHHYFDMDPATSISCAFQWIAAGLLQTPRTSTYISMLAAYRVGGAGTVLTELNVSRKVNCTVLDQVLARQLPSSSHVNARHLQRQQRTVTNRILQTSNMALCPGAYVLEETSSQLAPTNKQYIVFVQFASTDTAIDVSIVSNGLRVLQDWDPASPHAPTNVTAPGAGATAVLWLLASAGGVAVQVAAPANGSQSVCMAGSGDIADLIPQLPAGGSPPGLAPPFIIVAVTVSTMLFCIGGCGWTFIILRTRFRAFKRDVAVVNSIRRRATIVQLIWQAEVERDSAGPLMPLSSESLDIADAVATCARDIVFDTPGDAAGGQRIDADPESGTLDDSDAVIVSKRLLTSQSGVATESSKSQRIAIESVTGAAHARRQAEAVYVAGRRKEARCAAGANANMGMLECIVAEGEHVGADIVKPAPPGPAAPLRASIHRPAPRGAGGTVSNAESSMSHDRRRAQMAAMKCRRYLAEELSVQLPIAVVETLISIAGVTSHNSQRLQGLAQALRQSQHPGRHTSPPMPIVIRVALVSALQELEAQAMSDLESKVAGSINRGIAPAGHQPVTHESKATILSPGSRVVSRANVYAGGLSRVSIDSTAIRMHQAAETAAERAARASLPLDALAPVRPSFLAFATAFIQSSIYELCGVRRKMHDATGGKTLKEDLASHDPAAVLEYLQKSRHNPVLLTRRVQQLHEVRSPVVPWASRRQRKIQDTSECRSCTCSRKLNGAARPPVYLPVGIDAAASARASPTVFRKAEVTPSGRTQAQLLAAVAVPSRFAGARASASHGAPPFARETKAFTPGAVRSGESMRRIPNAGSGAQAGVQAATRTRPNAAQANVPAHGSHDGRAWTEAPKELELAPRKPK